MITPEHTKERLSQAYIYAVAAKAGVGLWFANNHDYGVDGNLRPVVIRKDGSRSDSGFNLEFQLKSTVDWSMSADGLHVNYDLDAEAYNKMADRDEDADGCILVLLCLHPDENQWLETVPTNLILRNCSYWARIKGPTVPNKSTKRIHIPVTNLLTPEALRQVVADEQARRKGFITK